MSSTSATSRPPLIQVQEASSQQTEFSNPKSYAQAVNAYAQTTQQQSLYAGNSFEALAHFLRSSGQIAEKETSEPSKTILVEPHRPFRRDTLKLASSAQRGLGEPFATHYALTSGNDAPEVRHLVEPAELEPVAKACSQDKMGQLLILRGYPSAAWLCTVGALYDVDPEFFRRHLDFILTSDSDLIPDGTPEMPSSTTNIFRFRIPTVGSYMGSVHQFGESPLQALRNAAKTAMTRYGHWLRIGTKWKIGDSVVRQFHVHNKEHFSIEQAVTIYFSRLRQSWDSWIGTLCPVSMCSRLGTNVGPSHHFLRFWDRSQPLSMAGHRLTRETSSCSASKTSSSVESGPVEGGASYPITELAQQNNGTGN